MDETLLDRLTRREQAATPAPWFEHNAHGAWVSSATRENGYGEFVADFEKSEAHHDREAENAGFVTEFRNAAALLLAVADDARAISNWFDTTHGNGFGHDHHCPMPTNGTKVGKGVHCTCGWSEAEPAFDRLSGLITQLETP